MYTLAAIGVGGALGALLRYWVTTVVRDWIGGGFPYWTLAVNVIGSLLIGFFYVWLFDRLNVGVEWRAFLVVGLLGGFTTFSAFSIETVNLLQQGAVLRSFVYVSASVLVCVAAAYAGVVAAKHLA